MIICLLLVLSRLSVTSSSTMVSEEEDFTNCFFRLLEHSFRTWAARVAYTCTLYTSTFVRQSYSVEFLNFDINTFGKQLSL